MLVILPYAAFCFSRAINGIPSAVIRIPMIANINCVNSVLINTNDPAKIAIKDLSDITVLYMDAPYLVHVFLKLLQQQMTYNRTTK